MIRSFAAFLAAALLAGCTSSISDTGLLERPRGPLPPQPAASTPTVAAPAPVPSAITAQFPKKEEAKISFGLVPFGGVPGNFGDSLTRRILDAAEARSLVMTRSHLGPTTYRVEGRLSAVATDSGGIVSWVFDVYDDTGSRLHRISGQEFSGGTMGDPWGGVSNNVGSTIARRLVDGLVSWSRRKQG